LYNFEEQLPEVHIGTFNLQLSEIQFFLYGISFTLQKNEKNSPLTAKRTEKKKTMKVVN